MEKRYWMYSENLDDFVEMTEYEFRHEEKSGHSIINNSITATINDDTILWDISFGNACGHTMKCLHLLERNLALNINN
jgi:hypothetical protein